MRLIYEPRVYLINRQVINDKGLDDFLLDHQQQGWETDTEVGADKTVEVGGRVCYMSFAKPRPGGNKAYIDHIKQVGHGSVLEHAVWTLLFTDVSRSLTHELVRHRAGVGYSQLSQRYVDESVAEYVVPQDLKNEVMAADTFLDEFCQINGWDDRQAAIDRVMQTRSEIGDPMKAGLVWLQTVARTHGSYVFLSEYLSNKLAKQVMVKKEEIKTIGHIGNEIDNLNIKQEERTAIRKSSRGAARSVLPNATETKIMVTANARAWRHMIEMRGAAPAEAEIRLLFYKAWEMLVRESVTLFGDYVWTMREGDAFPLDVTTPYNKV